MEGYNFSDQPTEAVRKWLRYAQEELPTTTSKAKRDILCHVIKGAASELLFRWRHNM